MLVAFVQWRTATARDRGQTLLRTNCADEDQSDGIAAVILTSAHIEHGFGNRSDLIYPPQASGGPILELSNSLFHCLREALMPLFPEEKRYADNFDAFEYMISLIHADMSSNGVTSWVMVGRFALDGDFSPHSRLPTVIRNVDDQVSSMRENWPYFQLGLFNGSRSRYNSARGRVLAQVELQREDARLARYRQQ